MGCQNEATKGSDYAGILAVTKTGKTCQSWSSQSPHSHMFGYVGSHNYCRNPDSDTGVWCFTTDANTIFEYCAVPLCEGNSNTSLTLTEIKLG